MSSHKARLWSVLRNWKREYGIHIRKQAPIGPYIADFVAPSRNLVVEVDGHQHLEPDQVSHDRKRDRWLAGEGYKVWRFSTGQLGEAFDGCVEKIMREAGLL